jgi:tetratricopeptide (TPR) repeat protein
MNPRLFPLLILLGALGGCTSHSKVTYAPQTPEQHRQAIAYKEDAERAEKAGNLDKAIELNHKAIQLEPDMGAAWNNLGLDLMHRGQPDDFVDAAQAFKRAADLMVTDDRPYQNLGVLYHDRGFADEALRYFALALERNPNSLASLRGAVACAKFLYKSDEAGLARLNRALMMETDPDWRKIMEFEKMRVQSDLAERAKPATGL